MSVRLLNNTATSSPLSVPLEMNALCNQWW